MTHRSFLVKLGRRWVATRCGCDGCWLRRDALKKRPWWR